MDKAEMKVVKFGLGDVIATSTLSCPMPVMSAGAFRIGYNSGISYPSGSNCDFYLDLNKNNQYDAGTDFLIADFNTGVHTGKLYNSQGTVIYDDANDTYGYVYGNLTYDSVLEKYYSKDYYHYSVVMDSEVSYDLQLCENDTHHSN